MKKIAFIRTGGQTGVDRSSLDVARKLNIPMLGWCPKNGWAEDMTSYPGLIEKYPELHETPSQDPSQRTRWNVRDSHATLIIIPQEKCISNGTSLTISIAQEMMRPYFLFSLDHETSEIVDWLNQLGNELTLNIAGPRESESPGIYEKCLSILESLLKQVNSSTL